LQTEVARAHLSLKDRHGKRLNPPNRKHQ
jgi:hypothetical protein